MEKVKPTIIKSEGMTFEELIVAYEKKCSMWDELKEEIFEKKVEAFDKVVSSKSKGKRPIIMEAEYNALRYITRKIEKLEKENDE